MKSAHKAIDAIESDPQLCKLRTSCAVVVNASSKPTRKDIETKVLPTIRYLFDNHRDNLHKICCVQVRLNGQFCADVDKKFVMWIPKHKKLFRTVMSCILTNRRINDSEFCEFVGPLNVDPTLYMNHLKRLDASKLYNVGNEFVNKQTTVTNGNIGLNLYGQSTVSPMGYNQCAFVRLCQATPTNINYVNDNSSEKDVKKYSKITNVKSNSLTDIFFQKVMSLDVGSPLVQFITDGVNFGSVSSQFLDGVESASTGPINTFTVMKSHTPESVKKSFDAQQKYNKELCQNNEKRDSNCIRSPFDGVSVPYNKKVLNDYCTSFCERLAACINPDCTDEELMAAFDDILGLFNVPRQNFQFQNIFDENGFPLAAHKHNFDSRNIYAELVFAYGRFSFKGKTSNMKTCIYVILSQENRDTLELDTQDEIMDFTAPCQSVSLEWTTFEASDKECLDALENCNDSLKSGGVRAIKAADEVEDSQNLVHADESSDSSQVTLDVEREPSKRKKVSDVDTTCKRQKLEKRMVESQNQFQNDESTPKKKRKRVEPNKAHQSPQKLLRRNAHVHETMVDSGVDVIANRNK